VPAKPGEDGEVPAEGGEVPAEEDDGEAAEEVDLLETIRISLQSGNGSR
jgi:hypothetical protein